MAVALSVSRKTWERAHATSAQCSASPTSCRGKMGRGESRSSLLEVIPKPFTLDEEEIGARALHICDRPHLSRGNAAASYMRRWWAGMMCLLYNTLESLPSAMSEIRPALSSLDKIWEMSSTVRRWYGRAPIPPSTRRGRWP